MAAEVDMTDAVFRTMNLYEKCAIERVALKAKNAALKAAVQHLRDALLPEQPPQEWIEAMALADFRDRWGPDALCDEATIQGYEDKARKRYAVLRNAMGETTNG
jgi:hypothetical protein